MSKWTISGLIEVRWFPLAALLMVEIVLVVVLGVRRKSLGRRITVSNKNGMALGFVIWFANSSAVAFAQGRDILSTIAYGTVAGIGWVLILTWQMRRNELR